jgi:hypothetical protein
MNCKPGDLAVVVKSATRPENVGRIVRCVRRTVRIGHKSRLPLDCWVVEPDITLCGAIADECLRPIRDQDGDDETLTWAGKPEQVTA